MKWPIYNIHNVYEHVELEALLDQDSCQTQEKLAHGQYFEKT